MSSDSNNPISAARAFTHSYTGALTLSGRLSKFTRPLLAVIDEKPFVACNQRNDLDAHERRPDAVSPDEQCPGLVSTSRSSPCLRQHLTRVISGASVAHQLPASPSRQRSDEPAASKKEEVNMRTQLAALAAVAVTLTGGVLAANASAGTHAVSAMRSTASTRSTVVTTVLLAAKTTPKALFKVFAPNRIATTGAPNVVRPLDFWRSLCAAAAFAVGYWVLSKFKWVGMWLANHWASGGAIRGMLTWFSWDNVYSVAYNQVC